MTWTELWTSIGDFFTWCFSFMKPIGNSFNYLMWVVIAILVFARIYVIMKQTKKAKSEGKLA
jgi:membrane protein DedA with SNARE-associated domain